MTLELTTRSHGVVESGFFSSYTQAARIGQYAFETKDLCNLAKYLAEHPETDKVNISGFDVDTFWDLFSNYHMRSVLETVERTEDLNDLKNSLGQNQGRMSLEEKARASKDRLQIPIEVKNAENLIKIGEYEMETPEFTFMIYYLLSGGWMGWSEHSAKPDYVDSVKAVLDKFNPHN